MRTVVIGVGNPYRSDDAAGLAVVRLVDAAAPPGIEVIEHDGEPSGLLDLWADADLAVVVDAVHTHTAPAGHIHRVEVDGDSTLGRGPRSSHGLGPGDAVALGQALDRLPRRLILFGIEGDTFIPGEGCSAQVEAAIGALAALVIKEVAR